MSILNTNYGFQRTKRFAKKCENFRSHFANFFAKTNEAKFREKKFRKNAKLSRNVWCLLVVLKSIFIFCFNPSIGLADKSLFKNESCILKIKSFLRNFRNLFGKILHLFFLKIRYFSRNFSVFFSQNFGISFREILAFFSKFSYFLFRENFAFFRKTDWSEISRKKRKFSNFSRANEMRKWSEMVPEKKLRETIFPFRWKT